MKEEVNLIPGKFFDKECFYYLSKLWRDCRVSRVSITVRRAKELYERRVSRTGIFPRRSVL